VIVASLMLGVGMRLHLGWLARRVGVGRTRWMMLVLLGWATAAIGSANWPQQFMVAQLAVGIIAGATLATFALPGLPALYGAGVASIAGPALCRAMTGTLLSVEGSWPLVCAASGAAVLALAAVSHALVRSANAVDDSGAATGQPTGQPPSDGDAEELSVAAAAA